MVTIENYEEYMILFADGELNAAEQQELLAFVKANPHLEAEMKAYAGAKLLPDTNMVFANKDALLKEEASKKGSIIINLRQWVAYGAAAGVAAVLLTVLLKWNGQKEVTITSNNPIKKVNSIDTIVKEKNVVVAPLVAEQKNVTKKVSNKNLKRIVTNPEPQRYTNKEQKKQVMQPVPEPEQKEEITRVDIAPMKKIKNNSRKDEEINMEQVVEVATATTNTKKSFIEKLPIDEEKKEGMIDMTNTIANRVQQVKDITNNLKETALVVKVGNHKLKINF